MLGKYLDNLRKRGALIHNITNYVTVNDIANALLAINASPIMADSEKEVEDIVSISDGLTINIGTLNDRTVNAMIKAGKKASDLGKIIVLDPVGAGASKFRTETAEKLIEEIDFDIIRGNISEIKTLYKGEGKTKGVDADISEKITEENLEDIVSFAKELSKKLKTIIVITGKIDIIADDKYAYLVRNGNPNMSSITGTGCILSSIINAFVSANTEEKDRLKVVTAAVVAMGIAGEIGYKNLLENEGNSTYRNRLIDALYNMNGSVLDEYANYENF
ncbi:MAG: hydroxyethylthiazole kinase [Andreesenia angusta]|nr:hydroxyethylthiazole kinase [Andreesenia angusta]